MTHGLQSPPSPPVELLVGVYLPQAPIAIRAALQPPPPSVPLDAPAARSVPAYVNRHSRQQPPPHIPSTLPPTPPMLPSGFLPPSCALLCPARFRPTSVLHAASSRRNSAAICSAVCGGPRHECRCRGRGRGDLSRLSRPHNPGLAALAAPSRPQRPGLPALAEPSGPRGPSRRQRHAPSVLPCSSSAGAMGALQRSGPRYRTYPSVPTRVPSSERERPERPRRRRSTTSGEPSAAGPPVTTGPRLGVRLRLSSVCPVLSRLSRLCRLSRLSCRSSVGHGRSAGHGRSLSAWRQALRTISTCGAWGPLLGLAD